MTKDIPMNSHYLCERFDELYGNFSSDREEKKIQSLLGDELGLFLFDVCYSMPHAPLLRSLPTIDSAYISDFGVARVIGYSFHVDTRTVGDIAMIFIARYSDNRMRLLAIETHCGLLYLCEYMENRHINYGVIEFETRLQKITDVLNKEPKRRVIEGMSQRNDWGDKLIVCLPSDGVRRHKTWCDHYDGDGHCRLALIKCPGSAHCEHYSTNINEVKEYRFPEQITLPVEIVDRTEKKTKRYIFIEHYHLAKFGEKLLDKYVLIKSNPYTFRIGKVTEEKFKDLVVEYDGKPHKYNKYTSCKNNAIYLFDGLVMKELTKEITE